MEGLQPVQYWLGALRRLNDAREFEVLVEDQPLMLGFDFETSWVYYTE